jgi:hypothetical protein
MAACCASGVDSRGSQLRPADDTIMAAPSPRLLLQRCTAPSTFSRAVPRRSVARTAARRALEQHGRTTAHGDPNAPLDVPRDGVERQALAMSKEAGDLGTVREDMFDDSKGACSLAPAGRLEAHSARRL